MTTIAVVDGIRIAIYVNDHPPPRFHAEFAEFEALISIATCNIIEGSMPRANSGSSRGGLGHGRNSWHSCGRRFRHTESREGQYDEEFRDYGRRGCSLSGASRCF
ncbi:MAG: DUF4160 domain-containing protein [Rhizobiales bacterium]|nr:DUF4160 domain-containing protein [Hyphomicrobiales bacterium]